MYDTGKGRDALVAAHGAKRLREGGILGGRQGSSERGGGDAAQRA